MIYSQKNITDKFHVHHNTWKRFMAENPHLFEVDKTKGQILIRFLESEKKIMQIYKKKYPKHKNRAGYKVDKNKNK